MNNVAVVVVVVMEKVAKITEDCSNYNIVSSWDQTNTRNKGVIMG